MMALRLDAIKKILAVFNYDMKRFEQVCPEIEDIVYGIDARHKIEKIVQETTFVKDVIEGAQEITETQSTAHHQHQQQMKQQ